MLRISIFFISSFAFLLISCASKSDHTNEFGHHYFGEHKFTYVTPAFVSIEDDQECSEKASVDAVDSIGSAGGNAPGFLLGAIGAIFQLGWAKAKMNSTYEESMKECLYDKGYDISM